jgi:hypothetical protein
LPALKIANIYNCRWQVEMSHPDHPSSDCLYRSNRAA